MDSIVQGTEEWFAIKRGKVSATHMADILMKSSTAGYRNYHAKLALERLTGTTEDTFCSFDMQRGIELEADARGCYAFETGNDVTQVAWVDHPTVPMAGCSPDGLVGDIGLVEFKCPKQATHLFDYILAEKIDRDYILQMQWQLACYPGRKWVDFCSYHPAFPVDRQLKIIRVLRDEETIKSLEDAAVEFNSVVETTLAQLRNQGEV